MMGAALKQRDSSAVLSFWLSRQAVSLAAALDSLGIHSTCHLENGCVILSYLIFRA